MLSVSSAGQSGSHWDSLTGVRDGPSASDQARDADETRDGDESPLHEPRRHGLWAEEQRGSLPPRACQNPLQYKWGTIFRREWFWKIEELTKRHVKGDWVRDREDLEGIRKTIEWFLERIVTRNEEMDAIKENDGLEE